MKKIAIVFIGILPLLTSCLPDAFVAGATAGGVVISDNRSIQTIWQDNTVTYKAQGLINSDPTLHQQAHITVTTFNHILLMVGQAPTEELRQQAYALVSKLPDIKRIYNQVSIEKPTSLSERTNDTWITAKVKADLVAEKSLHSSQIKVITENSNVYLMGLVTRSQGELAARVTSKVASNKKELSVRKVITLFEYQS